MQVKHPSISLRCNFHALLDNIEVLNWRKFVAAKPENFDTGLNQPYEMSDG